MGWSEGAFAGEDHADMAARQQALQDEARERQRQLISTPQYRILGQPASDDDNERDAVWAACLDIQTKMRRGQRCLPLVDPDTCIQFTFHRPHGTVGMEVEFVIDEELHRQPTEQLSFNFLAELLAQVGINLHQLLQNELKPSERRLALVAP